MSFGKFGGLFADWAAAQRVRERTLRSVESSVGAVQFTRARTVHTGDSPSTWLRSLLEEYGDCVFALSEDDQLVFVGAAVRSDAGGEPSGDDPNPEVAFAESQALRRTVAPGHLTVWIHRTEKPDSIRDAILSVHLPSWNRGQREVGDE